MAEPQPSGSPPWWRRHWLVLVLSAVSLLALVGYVVLAVRVLPAWIVSDEGANVAEPDRLKAIVDTRGALLGLLAPVVVAIGAVAAFLNYRETSAQNRRTLELSRETLDVTRRGQLTERFTKAIEQLGQTAENNLDIRLGGIYALEQIAKESRELHQPVMEILTAFLREHSRKSQDMPPTLAVAEMRTPTNGDQGAAQGSRQRLRADFQAAATVLGRRELNHDPAGFVLDLRGVALEGVDLFRARLQGALLLGAQLQEGVFIDARLQGARFGGAQLQRARFDNAALQRAGFPGTHLQAACFDQAQLEGAVFLGAHAQAASFIGAQLQGALFKTAELQRAVFSGAELQAAHFDRAQLEGAWFNHADLDGANFVSHGDREQDAAGLTWKQLAEARNIDKAVLPDYLMMDPESQPNSSTEE